MMDKATITALRGSIKKWEKIVSGHGYDEGCRNCPLCKMFCDRRNNSGTPCIGCPVMEATGEVACIKSPYGVAADAEFDYGRDSIEYMTAAMAELDFLKSLLPEGEKP